MCLNRPLHYSILIGLLTCWRKTWKIWLHTYERKYCFNVALYCWVFAYIGQLYEFCGTWWISVIIIFITYKIEGFVGFDVRIRCQCSNFWKILAPKGPTRRPRYYIVPLAWSVHHKFQGLGASFCRTICKRRSIGLLPSYFNMNSSALALHKTNFRKAFRQTHIFQALVLEALKISPSIYIINIHGYV